MDIKLNLSGAPSKRALRFAYNNKKVIAPKKLNRFSCVAV
jgi:hypothetical protein